MAATKWVNDSSSLGRGFVALLSAAGILTLMAGCAGGSRPPPSPAIAAVAVSCSPASIETNQTSACTATVQGTGAYSSAVTWSATEGAITSAGAFTPAAAVLATITATSTQDNTKSGTAIVSVAVPITITSVSVVCSPAAILTTQTSNCTATVQGTGGYSSAVTWSATDGAITSTGTFIPAAAGTGTITATSTQDSTKSGSAIVTVAVPITITSVSAVCSPASIDTNQTSACTAMVQGTGAYNSAVTWTATDGAITSAGSFTPAAAGTANITATSTEDSTKTGPTQLVVGNPVPTISALAPASLALQATPQLLTIGGTGFLPSSTVTLNGTGHAAVFLNANQLAVFLIPADLAATGTFPLAVANPVPGGGVSSANFVVASWQAPNQIIPLYPHSWGFFAGVSTVAPSGVANWPNALGQLDVTGAAGAGTLTLNSVVVTGSGGIGDYCASTGWAAIIQHDDGTYGTYTVSSCNFNTVNIYPTLAKSATGQSLWNIWDAVEGQHLSSMGYTGLATWLFSLKQYQGYISQVAGGRWFDAHGNAYGADFAWAGGLTTTNLLIPSTSIFQGLYEGTSYAADASHNMFQPLLYAAASQDPNATSIAGTPYRTEIGAWLAGQGVTHTVDLGGMSGYFHAFIGVSGQNGSTLPSRLTVTVVVDGVTHYSNPAIAGLTEITVPFTNGSAGSLSVTLTGSSPTAFDISEYAWYVWPSALDAQMQQPLLLPSSYVVVDTDSWGTMHGGGYATPLEALLASDPAGPSTGFKNVSVGGQTAIWAISNYATAVQPLNPNYVISSFQINDLVSGHISGYTITNGGTYNSVPTVTISGCAAYPAKATAILTGSQVTGLAFADVGIGCTLPTAVFSPPGAGATFTASPDTAAQLLSSIQTLEGLATAAGTTQIYLRSLLTASGGQALRIDEDEQQFNTLPAVLVPATSSTP